jgi:hypothetical protein
MKPVTRKPEMVLPFDEEVEVAPGFFIERRSVLSGLGGILLGLMSGAESFAALSEGIDEDLSFDQFLTRANPLDTFIDAECRALLRDWN